jgi:hypothetical protein
MANDKKPNGLYCQKCRTPIDIDASIDQLNPAAFKLLTGMSLSFVAVCTLAQLTSDRLECYRPAASLQEHLSPPIPPDLPLHQTPDLRSRYTVGKEPHVQAQCTIFKAPTWRRVPESCHVLHRRAHVRVDARHALSIASTYPWSRPGRTDERKYAESKRDGDLGNGRGS